MSPRCCCCCCCYGYFCCLQVEQGKLFERPTEWHLIFLDTRDRVFKYKRQVEYATRFTLNARAICRSLLMRDTYCGSGFTVG